MGWKNCRPTSRAQDGLRKIARREFVFAFDVGSGPLPMLLCNVDGSAAIEVEKVERKRGETSERRVEEPHRAAQRSALGVVIRRGELNESLIELDEIAFRFEPERFPRFVRFPEFGGVEVGDTFDQFIPSIAREIGRASCKVSDDASAPMAPRFGQRKLEIEAERFPRIVRFPEFGGVEVGDAFDQFIPSIARDHWRFSY